MSAFQPSQMRKGTRSCTECRRRKLRCSWTIESAGRCRRCEERDLTCLAQSGTFPTSKTLKPASKDRISQLEVRVNALSRALQIVEAKVEHIPHPDGGLRNNSTPGCDAGTEDESIEDDDISANDEVVREDDNAGMQSLFQTEWLGSESSSPPFLRNGAVMRGSRDANLVKARVLLQRLIPPREDVIILSDHVAGWSNLVAAMFENPTMAPSRIQIISSYDKMSLPDTDPWALANWLLALALTAQQVPEEANSPGLLVQSIRKRYVFARNVADVVESSILSHDKLLGTVQGLELSSNLLRVMLTRGRLQKTWLYLRRVVAVAELMGLPRIAKDYVIRVSKGESPDEEQFKRARLWTSIITIDRLSGTLNGLPVATRMYPILDVSRTATSETTQPLGYLLKLSGIAMEIQDLDELRLPGSSVDSYAKILRLDSNLKTLACVLPQQWLTEKDSEFTHGNIVWMLHSTVTMQLHLRYMLRDDESANGFMYSRVMGLEACQTVARVWRRCRAMLPFGFFLFPLMDIQAFAATVAMILISSNSYHSQYFHHIDKPALAAHVEQNMSIFENNSQQPLSSKFLRRAVSTLKTLEKLLQSSDRINGPVASLVLKVPLLGTVHIHRDQTPHQLPNNEQSDANTPKPTQLVNEQIGTDINHSMIAARQPESYEVLSWIIEEDGDALFQDYLMMDDTEEWMLASS